MIFQATTKHNRNPATILQRGRLLFSTLIALMPLFMEILIDQWFVVNLKRENWLGYSYIVGWVSSKHVMVIIGGCFGDVMDSVDCKYKAYTKAYSGRYAHLLGNTIIQLPTNLT